MNTMKTLFLFALMAFATADEEKYDLGRVDMEALGKNIKEFKIFSDCLINKGPCSELYQGYKDVVRESIEQTCRKCTDEIKRLGNMFFQILKTNLPEDYITFKQLYDPDNKYIDAMEAELSKYKTV